MKKLLIIILVLQLLVTFSIFFLFSKQNIHDRITINDTVINRVRIDSIHLLITKQESIINKINIREKYELEKAINSNDSDVVKLFRELVAK